MSLESARENLLWFSPRRVAVIAGNTVTELVRQKILVILFIFALVLIASALVFEQFTFEAQFKFLKDFCLGTISLMGMVLAIVGTATLLPAELESRTILTVLAKPVLRVEFLLGKFAGNMFVLLASLLVMALMMGGVMFYKERALVGGLRAEQAVMAAPSSEQTRLVEEETARILRQSRDPDVVKALLLIAVKVLLIAAITMFVSSFSTSMIFTVIISLLMVLICHLQSIALALWSATGEWIKVALVRTISVAFPDLGRFNITDEIVMGTTVPWNVVLDVSGYGVVMSAAYLALAWLFFEFREI